VRVRFFFTGAVVAATKDVWEGADSPSVSLSAKPPCDEPGEFAFPGSLDPGIGESCSEWLVKRATAIEGGGGVNDLCEWARDRERADSRGEGLARVVSRGALDEVADVIL
jgi:hypothetical protein